jgi:putative ATPase
MKEMGYGEDYKYAHDYPEHFVEQQHLPDSLKDKQFYTPGKFGYEKQVIERMKGWWRKMGKEEAKEESLDIGEEEEI